MTKELGLWTLEVGRGFPGQCPLSPLSHLPSVLYPPRASLAPLPSSFSLPKAPCLGESSGPAEAGMWQLTLGQSPVRQISRPSPWPPVPPFCLPWAGRLWTLRALVSLPVKEVMG